VRDSIRERLIQSAAENGRSLSEDVEWRVEHSFEWQETFGELGALRAKHASDMAKIEHGNTTAALHRLGWQKLPSPRGTVWAPPGVSPFPASGFVDDETAVAPIQVRAEPHLVTEDVLEGVVERAVERVLDRRSDKAAGT